jgi:hypothetical protein
MLSQSNISVHLLTMEWPRVPSVTAWHGDSSGMSISPNPRWQIKHHSSGGASAAEQVAKRAGTGEDTFLTKLAS